MIFNDLQAYMKQLRSWMEEPSGDHGDPVANYYENPHFAGVITNLALYLSHDSQLIIESKVCKLGPQYESFNQLGLVHFPPQIKEESFFVAEETAQTLLQLLETIRLKKDWKKENVWLDGIHRELRISHNDSPFTVSWNVESNNAELNQFAGLIDELPHTKSV